MGVTQLWVSFLRTRAAGFSAPPLLSRGDETHRRLDLDGQGGVGAFSGALRPAAALFRKLDRDPCRVLSAPAEPSPARRQSRRRQSEDRQSRTWVDLRARERASRETSR